MQIEQERKERIAEHKQAIVNWMLNVSHRWRIFSGCSGPGLRECRDHGHTAQADDLELKAGRPGLPIPSNETFSGLAALYVRESFSGNISPMKCVNETRQNISGSFPIPQQYWPSR